MSLPAVLVLGQPDPVARVGDFALVATSTYVRCLATTVSAITSVCAARLWRPRYPVQFGGFAVGAVDELALAAAGCGHYPDLCLVKS
jgi:hypothetical protein